MQPRVPQTSDAPVDRRTAITLGVVSAAGATPFLRGAESGHVTSNRTVENVRDHGAVGDGRSDDSQALQRSIDAAAETSGTVFFPTGTYLVLSPLRFAAVKPVSNTEPFGITIRGKGLGSVVLGGHEQGALFDFDLGPRIDPQVYMLDLALRDRGGRLTAINVGRLRRYSSFERIRMYGFREGFRLRQQIWGLDMRNVYIRGCRESALVVDRNDIGAGVATELRWFGGYVDNNGAATSEGGPYVPALDLYNCQEFKFYGVVFEGNRAGGVRISGGSENFLFSGCRFEETEQRFGDGPVHRIEDGARNIHYQSCELAYHKAGRSGERTFNLFQISEGPVTLANCQFVDLSNTNTSDVFVDRTNTADVTLRDCITGIGSNYRVSVSPRYEAVKIGTSRHIRGDGPPTDGAWAPGDTVYNSSPRVGHPFAWVCIKAGSPGRWGPVGVIGLA